MPVRSCFLALATMAAGLGVGACESGRLAEGGPLPKPPGADAMPPPAASGTVSAVSFSFGSSGDPAFDAWRSDFASRASQAGRRPDTVRAVLDGLIPVEAAVQTQSFDNQAEFVKPIWEYARSALSPSRIANGRARLSALETVFGAIESAYAPPREILAAIWGMESSYGGFIGTDDAPRVLASQAAIGRRKDFNEGELLAIMQLIEKGAASRDQFARASWAGALGQTQFMPSSLLQYGRDFDGDGRIDIWSAPGDALASAANYLSGFGWRRGQPWAVEIRIPDGFDYSLGDGRRLPVSAWISRGLQPVAETGLAGSEALEAELFLPAGSFGPAFLLFENFRTIKRYNNADSYALAIGLLADQLAGRPQLSRPWPVNIRMLTQQEARELQAGLNALGYNAGAVDGVIGRGTRGALQRFQKDRALTADGFPTPDMLRQVKDASRDS